jgi:tartrate dehydrogenase/decarboxylase/D-malate dehydrogenase
MMLEHLGHQAAADAVVKAIEATLAEGNPAVLTPDIGGQGNTQTLGKAIAERL